MTLKENTLKLIQNLQGMIQADTQLRNSQIEAMHQFMDNPDQPDKGVFNLATGVGKTRIMSMLALAHLQNNPNGKVIVVVPNTDLIEQERKSFQEYRDAQEEFRQKQGLPALDVSKKLDTGAFYTHGKDTDNQIIFTTYSSLGNLKENINSDQVGLLLLDEAHHGVSEKRTKTIQSFDHAMRYGMTATPFYDQERSTEKVIGPIIAKRDVADAIREGDLAECKNVLMVSNLSVDLSETHSGNNDYREGEFYQAIAKALHGNSATSDNKENWQQAHHYVAAEVAKFYYDYVDEHIGKLVGKKCLVNCRSQEEARIQAQEFNKLFGKIVARVHTSDECDDQTIKDFKEGDLPIVCQVGKLTEGFDMPNLDMTINYPTCSRVREAQGAARCLRNPKVPSNLPNMVEKKLGLVVDIAFKHPKYDSIVDSIHQNGQVLFQDILGGVIVQHNDKSTRVEELDKDTVKRMREESQQKENKLNFQIISEVQELVKLANEEKELQKHRFINELSEDMLTHIDLGKRYHKTPDRIETILATIHNKKILEDDQENSRPMVTKGKRRGHEAFAIRNLPNVLKKLEEMYPELLQSREAKKIAARLSTVWDLCHIYHIDHETGERLQAKLLENKVVFYGENDLKKEKPLPIIYEGEKEGQTGLILNKDPMALKRIDELFPKLAIRRKCRSFDGYTTDFIYPNDFIYAFGIDERKAGELLQKSYAAHDTYFEKDDKLKKIPKALVFPVLIDNKMMFVMPNKEEAKNRMRELYPDDLVPLFRKGMVTVEDFKYGSFHVPSRNKKKGEEALKALFDNKAVFFADEDTNHEHPLPIVERVKYTYGLPFLALTDHPKGQRIFMEIANSIYYHEPSTLQATLEKLSKCGQVNFLRNTGRSL